MEKMLLSIDEAAYLAGIGRTRAYEFVRSGLWDSVKVGKSLKIPRSAVVAWVRDRESEAKERAASMRTVGV